MKNPVPSNLLEAQKLDAYYIEELLSENKRIMNLQNKKTLKVMQEKVVDILPPISRLYHIMEAGQGAGSNDPRTRRIFFDQTVLLIGQVFNSLIYYRRKNVLPILIDNKARVKEITKDIGNPYLFVEKFEKKLNKVTNANLKKALFTRLQSKPAATTSDPFERALCPKIHQEGGGHRFFLEQIFSRDKIILPKSLFSTENGNSEPRDLHTCTSSNEKCDFSNRSAQSSNNRAASVFSWELVKATQSFYIL